MISEGRIAHIFRHPIKAHGREELASVWLSAGEAMPWDRHWAVAHDLSKFDPSAPAWTPCANFQRGARTASLMAIETWFDPASGAMRLTHPQLEPLDFHPESQGDQLIEWLRPISPTERFRPQSLVRAPGRAMTDSDYPTLSVKNLASNAALGQHMATDLSLHRWRGNLWLDGFAPWEEFGWIGRRLRIGGTLLDIRERIGRCKATSANPATGVIDADTLKGLRDVVGDQDFGVYAVVIENGEIRQGDSVEVLG